MKILAGVKSLHNILKQQSHYGARYFSTLSFHLNAKPRYCKLIMVASVNNNKFYEMIENGNVIDISYGRVGSTAVKRTANVGQWYALISSKLKKGYVDVTEMSGTVVSGKGNDGRSSLFVNHHSEMVKDFLNQLNRYSNTSISSNYTVTVQNVTKEQVAKAQSIMDELFSNHLHNFNTTIECVEEFNRKLLELYAVIPRKMAQVREFLLQDTATKNEARKLLDNQQEILDVMATQVQISKQDYNEEKNSNSEEVDFLTSSGLLVEEASNHDIEIIKRLMGPQNQHLLSRAFCVTNVKTQKEFDKWLTTKNNRKTDLFWHGSRNENFLSIMMNGLQLRPALNGRMFGHGNYFGKFTTIVI